MVAEVVAPPEPVTAERWRRVVGYVVDSALSSVVFLSGLSVLRPLGHGPLGFLVVLGWCAPLVNHGLGVAVWGQSLGKVLTRTKVVLVATEGVPGWGPSMVRWAVPGVVGFVRLAVPHAWWLGIGDLVWTLVVYAPVIGPARRGIHDHLAGTLVVRT